MGYVCAPREVAKQMLKIHQYAIMCAPTTSQYAAIEAATAGDADIESMRLEYDHRRKYILGRLRDMGLECFEPKGAFYVFPCIQSTGMTSEEFCEEFLIEKHVAVIPGTAFGDCGEGFVRMSYCNSIANIMEAMDRLEQFLNEMKNK